MRSGRLSTSNLVWILGIVLLVCVILRPIVLPITDRGCQKSPCQSNLKQCVQALKMYSDDYDGKLPSSFLVHHARRWSIPDFYAFSCKAGQLPPKPNARHSIWQILYDNMKNKDIMFCDKDPVDRTFPNARTSYSYKIAMDKAWYGIGCDAPRRSMGDYQYQSDQVCFFERISRHFGKEEGLRNGAMTNVAFLDTHVDTVVIKHATSGDPLNCAANADGEPMYYSFYVPPVGGSSRADKGPAKHIDPTKYSDGF